MKRSRVLLFLAIVLFFGMGTVAMGAEPVVPHSEEAFIEIVKQYEDYPKEVKLYKGRFLVVLIYEHGHKGDGEEYIVAGVLCQPDATPIEFVVKAKDGTFKTVWAAKPPEKKESPANEKPAPVEGITKGGAT